jgi:hypothetical protein
MIGMNPSHDLLPLFSLPMMVLPGEVVALHIFEPRYREMVAHCRAEPKPDGDFVIQYREDGRSCAYATAVGITRVLHEHDDGRLDLLVEGRSRVEVVDIVRLHLYPSAQIVPVLDKEEDWDNDLANRVYAAHRQLLVEVTGDEPPDSFYAAEGGIAFRVAACGGMDFRSRLWLLKSSSENDRLRMVEDHLKTTLPQMTRVLGQARSVAGAFALRVADPEG